MILKINQLSQQPIYLQIRDQIVEAVASGCLCPGDNLPSVRSLAADLGVNLHTVNKAYAVLRDEGYVLMRGRSGAFIADYEQLTTPERSATAYAKLEETIYHLAVEHKVRGGTSEQFVDIVQSQLSAVYEQEK